MCRHARAGDRTTKRTSGNTVAPEEAWCSISAWVADAMGRSSSWDSSKAFSKLTDTRLMIRSAGRALVILLFWALAKARFLKEGGLMPQGRVQNPLLLRW